MGDARLRLDAIVDQAVGDAARRPVERGIARLAAGVDQGRGVGAVRCVLSHDVRQARDFDAHPNASPDCGGIFSALGVISRV
jgi:hypothetical protein